MKTLKLFVSISVLCLVFMNACVVVDSNINGLDGDNNRKSVYGSGRIISIDKDFSDFNNIEISTGFGVEIKKSDSYSVTIEIDDNLREYVNAYKSGNKIFIGLESGNNYKDVTLRAIIETPDINNITASGGTIIEMDGYNFDHSLLIDLSGGSVIKGTLYTGDFNLKLSGGGIAELNGKAKDMDISGSGGCILNLFDFPVNNCSIDFSGGSIANINVTGKLDLALSGGSVLKYKGNPSLGNISISGGSILQKVN